MDIGYLHSLLNVFIDIRLFVANNTASRGHNNDCLCNTHSQVTRTGYNPGVFRATLSIYARQYTVNDEELKRRELRTSAR